MCLLFSFEDRVFLCSYGVYPGTRSLDQAGLELKDIFLFLPLQCWE